MVREPFLAAAVQAAPILPLNKDKTVDLVCQAIAEAADHGPTIIVFPECFIPMYPNWSIDLSRPKEWMLNLRELTYHAITVPGPETERIGRVTKEKGVYAVIGINERDNFYQDALYNSIVYIGPTGEVMGKHRKIFPSNREKVSYARGDASGLKVYDTPLGRLGGLVCYEHLQPLLKYSLIAQNEQIHCALWPGRNYRHIIDATSRAMALEGQSFVIISSLYIPESAGEQAGLGNASWMFFGGSGIINPLGEYVAGPLYDQEGIVYGEIDLTQITYRKATIDTTGRDSAWETISMNINLSHLSPIKWQAPEQVDPNQEP